MPTITKHEIGRNNLVALATAALAQSMNVFAERVDCLTPLEWLKALQTIQARLISEGLNEEWKEPPR